MTASMLIKMLSEIQMLSDDSQKALNDSIAQRLSASLDNYIKELRDSYDNIVYRDSKKIMKLSNKEDNHV